MSTTQLFTIAYTSECTIPKDKQTQEISQIIEVAQSENALRGISGVLLFMNNRFLQILEGEQDHLYTLMQNIEKDTRHKDVEILVEKPILARGFPDWALNFYELDNDNKFSFENLGKIRSGLSKNALSSGREILTFYNSLLK